MFGAGLYTTEAAVAASVRCGVPTAVADLHPGETWLDLGSGAGADVPISARRVGPTDKAKIGLDMTTEMLELARRNATEAGCHERRVLPRLPVGHPTARRERRRGDLQLRGTGVGPARAAGTPHCCAV